MKIREIRAVGLRGGTPEGGWIDELDQEDCIHTLIEIITDEGAKGLGSVFTNDGLVRSALALLEPFYIGENPLEPERVSEKLHQHMFWHGRGGSVTYTISGIDIAMWDLLGKATGQPVGRLLGGRYRDRVMPYASLLFQMPGPFAEHLLEVKALGFRAYKIGCGPFGQESYALDEAMVRTSRDVLGEDAILMVDAAASRAYWKQDYKWSLRTAQMLADYDVYFFEEPLKPEALKDYVALRRQAPVQIAAGEALTRHHAYQPYLEAGAFDIVQPDVTKVGGISESRRIAWMAQDHGVRFIPHGWNTAVGLAADLQLASAFPDTEFVEYLPGSPYIDEIVEKKWALDADGMLEIPNRPGLGIELDQDVVAKYS